MALIKAVVAYDGSSYAGWQKQENALGIQEVMEKVLTKIHKKTSEIVASGRTDAKVHALGQVIHFEKMDSIPAPKYKEALNALLPEDIRILETIEVEDQFHARFSAKEKEYEYICTYDLNNPFIYRYKEKLRSKLDIRAMQEAAEVLMGSHDFTSFSSSKIDPRKPRIKTITKIDIFEQEQDVHFIFIGDGFLRYQVRMMTGTLIEVGKHNIDKGTVKIILEKKHKDACRYNASPQGLYLKRVYY